ncbi:hypothetical protein [Hyphococcus sp.]|uniref:hypothetical protein n=1 Tax=Hyphococcus sp. TaxID=2038636 RepID=UPI003CCC0BAD
MRVSGISVFAFFLAVSGCASLGQSNDENSNAQTANSEQTLGNARPAPGDRLNIMPLPEAVLPEKKCGMVLWTLEGRRPAAIFRFVSDERAEMNLSGEMINFNRVNFSGSNDFGVFEQQVFRSENGIEAEVNAQFGLSFDGGAYLERGVIKLRDNDGWSLITPAAGIAGCRD